MPQDSHQGGRLEDMAAEGTTIPSDAGTQRLVSLLHLRLFDHRKQYQE